MFQLSLVVICIFSFSMANAALTHGSENPETSIGQSSLGQESGLSQTKHQLQCSSQGKNAPQVCSFTDTPKIKFELAWNSFEDCMKAINMVDLCVKFVKLSKQEGEKGKLIELSWNSYEDRMKAINMVDLCVKFVQLSENTTLPKNCDNDSWKFRCGSSLMCIYKHRSALSSSCGSALGLASQGTSDVAGVVDHSGHSAEALS